MIKRDKDLLLFCEEINDFYKEELSYKIRVAKLSGINNIHVSKGSNTLHLRFKPEGYWGNKTVVISNISFNETRKGHGTNLLKFLVKKAQVYNYNMIGIEETNEASESFALKFRFKPYVFKNVIKERWYISNTDELENILQIVYELKR